MRQTFFFALLFSLSFSAWPVSNNVLEETLYRSYKKHLEGPQKFNIAPMGSFEQSLFVDALWDLLEEGSPSALSVLDAIQDFYYDLSEKLRIGILKIKYNGATTLSKDLTQELLNALRAPTVDTKLIYTLAAYEELLLKAGHKDIIALAKTHQRYYDVAVEEERKREIADDVIADLFHHTPDVTTYMNGEYVKSVKIFMFCRENRIYPCLMVMKDIHGEIVRNTDNSLWTHKALASSAKGLPSYYHSGNTPEGILTIDSVMPDADEPISFGKFRRMILNFVPKSANETLLKSLLPKSSLESDWWKPGVVARDVGRNLLRIHGTGKINEDPTTPYFPFMRTSGCIAQRENTYAGMTYKDQRDLLDNIMKAMDLEAAFDNEPKIKGILYLVEIDDKNAAVEADDLRLRGIE